MTRRRRRSRISLRSNATHVDDDEQTIYGLIVIETEGLDMSQILDEIGPNLDDLEFGLEEAVVRRFK